MTSDGTRRVKINEAEVERIWNSLRPAQGYEDDPEVRLDVQGWLIMRDHYGDGRRASGWRIIDGEAVSTLVRALPGMG